MVQKKPSKTQVDLFRHFLLMNPQLLSVAVAITSVYLTKHSLSVGLALLFTYPVLVIEAVGYGIIAYGARLLKRIEEV